jgi:hypothetical protein
MRDGLEYVVQIQDPWWLLQDDRFESCLRFFKLVITVSAQCAPYDTAQPRLDARFVVIVACKADSVCGLRIAGSRNVIRDRVVTRARDRAEPVLDPWSFGTREHPSHISDVFPPRMYLDPDSRTFRPCT